MQWHWGNIGSFLGGAAAAVSALIVAAVTLIRGPAALTAWQARQRAQADAAREQAQTTRLERRRGLSGWSANGVNTYPVTLVTEAGELGQAVTELTGGQPTAYAVVRVTGGADSGSVNLALSLRQLVQAEGYISRPPTTGERKALETGLDAMGIPRAAYGQTKP